MTREVRHEAMGPLKIDPAAWPRDEHGDLKPIWICACGISSQFPLCDGSHKACRGEVAGQLYRYDPTTKAVVGNRAEPASE